MSLNLKPPDFLKATPAFCARSVDFDYTAPEICLQIRERIGLAADLQSTAALVCHLVYGNTPQRNRLSLIKPYDTHVIPRQLIQASIVVFSAFK